jgi:hypothetical protein
VVLLYLEKNCSIIVPCNVLHLYYFFRDELFPVIVPLDELLSYYCIV